MRVQSLSFANRRIKTNNDEGMRLIRLQIDTVNRHDKWSVYVTGPEKSINVKTCVADNTVILKTKSKD